MLSYAGFGPPDSESAINTFPSLSNMSTVNGFVSDTFIGAFNTSTYPSSFNFVTSISGIVLS